MYVYVASGFITHEKNNVESSDLMHAWAENSEDELLTNHHIPRAIWAVIQDACHWTGFAFL